MVYGLLANAVLVLHFAFIAFVVIGGLAVLRWPRLAWIHIPAASWGALIELFGWTCPLTPLENSFRKLGGEAAYSGGFIDHYLASMIYPPGLTRTTQFLIGAGVVAINVYIYWTLCKRARHRAPI